MVTTVLLSSALHAFLAAQSGGAARRFFRPDGFDDAVYAALLERLHAEGDALAGQPLWVRTIAPLPGYEACALETDKSATWYRNHVPPGYALVLIFNRPTSDAQSLKDVYPVTESLLATEGLEHLIRAAFATYQPSPEQIGVLREFLARLRPSPQLRDLAEFLRDLDAYLHAHPGATMETAIAESLPALGLFRCRELAEVLNTAKGDAPIRPNRCGFCNWLHVHSQDQPPGAHRLPPALASRFDDHPGSSRRGEPARPGGYALCPIAGQRGAAAGVLRRSG